MEIINNQIKSLESEKNYKDLEYKSKKSEWNRTYYLKNRETLIKKYTEYGKHYEEAQ